ncbi:MAG: hypothetical protein IPH11_07305 [Ignavibacteriales bacterium]|nr:hypothetical protein [Ignavibacteriales bacterium]
MNDKIKIALLVFNFSISPLMAQWISDSTINNPICVANLEQVFPNIVSDGNGGAIIFGG